MESSKIKILVVDDEEDIAYYTAKMLTAEGFEAFKAVDGASALAIFEKERPQICLLDVHLGYSKIDGMEVLEKIRKTDDQCICIMITRITDKDVMERAKKLGVKEYLYKPLAMEDWLGRVHVARDIIRKRTASNG